MTIEKLNKTSKNDIQLKQLYDKLTSEGCNFYIEGLGGNTFSDVDVLGLYNGNWEVYYTERGIKYNPIFSSPDKKKKLLNIILIIF